MSVRLGGMRSDLILPRAEGLRKAGRERLGRRSDGCVVGGFEYVGTIGVGGDFRGRDGAMGAGVGFGSMTQGPAMRESGLLPARRREP